MREKYESLSLTVLKDLAKARGIKGLAGLKKEQIVELMLAEDEKAAAAEAAAAAGDTSGSISSGNEKKCIPCGMHFLRFWN